MEKLLPREITAAVTNLPATIDGAAEDGTAFPIFDHVPQGHGLWPVIGNQHAPHLCSGEWVLVDFNDRDIRVGDVYLTIDSSGPKIWQVRLLPAHQFKNGANERHFALAPLNQPTRDRNGKPLPGQRLYAADGPFCEWHLRAVTLGRVVGIIDPRIAASAMVTVAHAEFLKKHTHN